MDSLFKWPKQLNAPLEAIDPEIAGIIELEKARQWKGLELIPSENFTFFSVMQVVRSVMTNKYSEGYHGARYYGGKEYIDMAESLCQKRALEAFQLDLEKWELEKSATLFRPKLIVMGASASAYVRLYAYECICNKVCNKQKAIMLLDMAHISGLVAASMIPSPFDYANTVITTTHKSLRGPRGAMIFFRKGLKEINKLGKEVFYEYEGKINQAIFLGLQGIHRTTQLPV